MARSCSSHLPVSQHLPLRCQLSLPMVLAHTQACDTARCASAAIGSNAGRSPELPPTGKAALRPAAEWASTDTGTIWGKSMRAHVPRVSDGITEHVRGSSGHALEPLPDEVRVLSAELIHDNPVLTSALVAARVQQGCIVVQGELRFPCQPVAERAAHAVFYGIGKQLLYICLHMPTCVMDLLWN